VCSYSNQFAPVRKEIRKGASISIPSTIRCSERRKLTRFLPPVEDLIIPYAHRDCTCNEERSLIERVLAPTPQPTKAGLARLDAEARLLSETKLKSTVPLTYDEFVNCYSAGRQRTRYQRAADSLKERTLHVKRESKLNSFVKSEKLNPIKVDPAPRMIQARTARFNVEIGRFLRPIEKQLYQMRHQGFRCIGKGLSPQGRAGLLRRQWDSMDKPVAVSIDCTRFDLHVSEALLKLEHKVYLSSNNDPMFQQLLNAQIRNVGFTSSGIRYKLQGGRMSGDMNTSTGNCLLMVMMVRAAARQLQIKDYRICDDGDDCLIMIETDDLPKLAGLKDAFLSFGHVVKFENIAFEFHEIEWCKTRPVLVDGVWKLIPDWRRVLGMMAAGTRYWHDKAVCPHIARACGMCVLSYAAGVPILQDYALALMRSSNKISTEIYYMDVWRHAVKPTGMDLTDFKERPISATTRTSFMETYGMSVSYQREVELALKEWTIDPFYSDAPLEVRPGWDWDYSVLNGGRIGSASQ